ncbi:MAG: hypothetical protein H0W71_09400 [Sphingomonas sp.]|nr:hypothetical protein [Sphingomonas sp.]
MSAKIGSYRIRWAVVSYGNGHRLFQERMCIAERLYRLFGWWPTTNGEWRFNEEQAHQDIERDRIVRSPLPKPKVIQP